MALSLSQQIAENIKKSENVLIVFRKNWSPDSLCTALALSLALQKLNKSVDIVCHDFSLPSSFEFLPQSHSVQKKIGNIKKFIITLDISKTKITDFSYEVKDELLNIFITPQDGSFTEQDVKTKSGAFDYHIIFTIDTQDLDSLGAIYDENRDFFFSTPIINIDRSSQNENYGQINLVELTSTSSSEVLYNLFSSLNPKLIDEDVATCLLAGIMSATKAFRSPSVTPKAFEICASLIENKARREEVVQHLYYNRNLSTLKLWGSLLSRLQTDEKSGVVWSEVKQENFSATQTDIHDLHALFDELISTIPKTKAALLFYETTSGTSGVLAHGFQLDVFELLKEYHPQNVFNSANIDFENQPFEEMKKSILEKLTTNTIEIGKNS